ncbi:MAG: ABC transporter permease [Myxococcota bacterium]
MSVLVGIALRNLLQARRRTGLLGLAIGLVTMMLVLLLSMSQGIEDNLVKSATTVSSGHVTVGGFYKVTAGSAAPILSGVGELRAIVEQETPNLDYVVDRQRGWGKLVSPTGSMQAGLSGIDPAAEERLLAALRPAPTSEYREGGGPETEGNVRDIATRADAVVLFASQAKRLEVGVGDVLTVQTETVGGRTNTADLTVVAVVRDVGMLSMWSVYVPREVTLELYQLSEDTTGALWVYLDDIDRAEETMAHLRTVFASRGYQLMDHQSAPFWMKFETVSGEDWTGQKLDLTVWRDEVSFLNWVLTAFDSVTWFLVAILVSIIAVGIMNTMWNAVRERTREIGTMRAIGMTRRRVLGLFLLEAALLGLGSTVVGALAGASVALAVDAAAIKVPIAAMEAILLSETIHLAVRPQALVSAILTLTMFTALSALWPATRAASLSPVTALGQAE